MSLKLTRVMPSFDGVAAGQTATLRCPIGFTYHQLWVTYGGTFTLAQMTEIRVVANGQNIMRFDSGAALDDYNTYEGRTAAGGILCIDFDRYNLRTRAGEEFTSLGTGAPNDPTPVTTLSVEIDIAAGATAPTLSARAIQSLPRPLGLIKKVRTFIYNPPGSGDFEISDLPRGDLINKVYFNISTNAISRVQVQRDNFTVYDRTELLNDRIQADGVRVPQTDYWVYDPTENGNGAEGLVTANVNDLRFILTTSGAMACVTGVEYIGSIEA